LYECQNKGLTKFTFRKSLILKDAILVVLDRQRLKWRSQKEKAGVTSRSPYVALYAVKHTTK
jgi:hypothetical protein